MDKSWNPPYPAGQHRRSGRKSSHAKNDLRLKRPVDGSAKRQAFVKTAKETKKRRRKWRWQSHGGQFFHTETFSTGERQSVDIFLRYQQHHFMPAVTQHFCHGDAGKKMSASSSACDYCIHKI